MHETKQVQTLTECVYVIETPKVGPIMAALCLELALK